MNKTKQNKKPKKKNLKKKKKFKKDRNCYFHLVYIKTYVLFTK